MKAHKILTAALLLTASAFASPDPKVDALAHAIAKAEGFGVKGAIPTRYHNPGNIRSSKAGVHYPGQIGLNRCGYVIFRTDAYGWAALTHQIEKVLAGQSSFYSVDMTLMQLARRYATGWKLWSRNVATALRISPNTTLRDFFELPPTIQFTYDSNVLAEVLR